MFFLIISYVTPNLFTLFSILFSIIYISYTIHPLINSFLILDKRSVDLILILLISLQYCSFCICLCFSSSIIVLILSFFMLYFLSNSSCFYFILKRSKMFIRLLTLFINFLLLIFLFTVTSTSLKANHFSYINCNCFYQDICISNIFSYDMF